MVRKRFAQKPDTSPHRLSADGHRRRLPAQKCISPVIRFSVLTAWERKAPESGQFYRIAHRAAGSKKNRLDQRQPAFLSDVSTGLSRGAICSPQAACRSDPPRRFHNPANAFLRQLIMDAAVRAEYIAALSALGNQVFNFLFNFLFAGGIQESAGPVVKTAPHSAAEMLLAS